MSTVDVFEWAAQFTEPCDHPRDQWVTYAVNGRGQRRDHAPTLLTYWAMSGVVEVSICGVCDQEMWRTDITYR